MYSSESKESLLYFIQQWIDWYDMLPGKFCVHPGACASHSNVLFETNECSSMITKYKKIIENDFFFFILNDLVFLILLPPHPQ
jgi:hypothetical protein